jgi:hypothetical protein
VALQQRLGEERSAGRQRPFACRREATPGDLFGAEPGRSQRLAGGALAIAEREQGTGSIFLLDRLDQQHLAEGRLAHCLGSSAARGGSAAREDARRLRGRVRDVAWTHNVTYRRIM